MRLAERHPGLSHVDGVWILRVFHCQRRVVVVVLTVALSRRLHILVE